jgi:hypothetical protein
MSHYSKRLGFDPRTTSLLKLKLTHCNVEIAKRPARLIPIRNNECNMIKQLLRRRLLGAFAGLGLATIAVAPVRADGLARTIAAVKPSVVGVGTS